MQSTAPSVGDSLEYSDEAIPVQESDLPVEDLILPTTPHKIKKTTLAKLFWGKFPYCVDVKVNIVDTIPGERTGFNMMEVYRYQSSRAKSGPWIGLTYYEACFKHKHDISELEQALLKFCPKDKKSFRSVDQYDSRRYYFLTKEECNHFITKVAKKEKDYKILEIVKPADSNHVSLLQNDHKIVTRTTLFHEIYEWKVTFKYMVFDDVREVRMWADEIFKDEANPDRYLYRPGMRILALFLQSEDDVMLVKLAHHHLINKIEKAVILTTK